MKKSLFGILLLFIMMLCHAESQPKPLSPEQAFSFSAYMTQPNQLLLQWKIAPGYYLYQDKLRLYNHQKRITLIPLPQSTTKQDILHKTYQVYTGILNIIVTLDAKNAIPPLFTVEYQGCSLQDFCYSPVKKDFKFNSASPATAQFIPSAKPMPPTQLDTEQMYAEKLFAKHDLFLVLLSFLGLGLLLAFTPCILPMVPILYGIIIGHRKKNPSTVKAFSLSLAYVLGMAITYAIAGMVAALIGSHVQTTLQKPWIIILFSTIFVLLALSLFGLYEFQLPARWQKNLTELSNRQKGGSYFGVFLMGSISTLIVSPCLSPALVGVLAYIAHTGNIGLGALALLSLGIGMGLPLLIVGASAIRFLPKTGAWMQTVEHLVGIMMLAVAIWLLSRIIPGTATLFLWSALLIVSAILMGHFTKVIRDWQPLRHSVASLALIYGIVLFIGAIGGNSDPLHPWENWRFTSRTTHSLFTTVNNMAQFDQQLAQAKQEKKWVILDFYADWCDACVSMDRYLFSKPAVKQMLNRFVLLRSDITANNAFDKAIMQRFRVIAPPTLLFFTPDGKELSTERLIGDVTDSELLTHIQQLEGSNE